MKKYQMILLVVGLLVAAIGIEGCGSAASNTNVTIVVSGA